MIWPFLPLLMCGSVAWLIITGRLAPTAQVRIQPLEPSVAIPERYRVADDLSRSLAEVIQAAERDADPQPKQPLRPWPEGVLDSCILADTTARNHFAEALAKAFNENQGDE